MAEVLLYNPDVNYDLEKFKALVADKNIGIRYAGKEDIDQYVGYLAGEEGYEKREVSLDFDPALDFAFILFIGFERNELFDFLDAMREAGLSIQHKANETEQNVRWTLRELLIENDREGKMMGLIHRINTMLAHADEMIKSHGTDEKLLATMEEIQGYFSEKNIFELEAAEMYHKKLFNDIIRYKESKGIL